MHKKCSGFRVGGTADVKADNCSATTSSGVVKIDTANTVFCVVEGYEVPLSILSPASHPTDDVEQCELAENKQYAQ